MSEITKTIIHDLTWSLSVHSILNLVITQCTNAARFTLVLANFASFPL